MEKGFELEQKRYEVEAAEKWREWADKIPALHFEPEWNVHIIPPYGGAFARFYIKNGNKYADVYFDVLSRMGWMYDTDAGSPIPYFELYPWEGDCKRYYMDEVKELENDIRKILE